MYVALQLDLHIFGFKNLLTLAGNNPGSNTANTSASAVPSAVGNGSGAVALSPPPAQTVVIPSLANSNHIAKLSFGLLTPIELETVIWESGVNRWVLMGMLWPSWLCYDRYACWAVGAISRNLRDRPTEWHLPCVPVSGGLRVHLSDALLAYVCLLLHVGCFSLS